MYFQCMLVLQAVVVTLHDVPPPLPLAVAHILPPRNSISRVVVLRLADTPLRQPGVNHLEQVSTLHYCVPPQLVQLQA